MKKIINKMKEEELKKENQRRLREGIREGEE